MRKRLVFVDIFQDIVLKLSTRSALAFGSAPKRAMNDSFPYHLGTRKYVTHNIRPLLMEALHETDTFDVFYGIA